MEEPPAPKPNQHERHKALRQRARAGDPVAQAQVAAINAGNRASAAKAKAEGRQYRSPAQKAAYRARVKAARLLARTPAEVEEAQQRQARLAAAKRKREAAAAAPPKPVLSAEERVAQAVALNLARNRAAYQAHKQRMAAGDPDAIAKYEQRLAKNRQRAAAKANPLTPEQRSEIARQSALKRWNRSKLTPEQRSESIRKATLKRWSSRAAPSE